MRVLLTGHQGYIGTVLSQRLEAAGHQPVGFDTGWFSSCRFGPDEPRDAVSVGEDLRDVTTRQLEGFDAVAHLGSLSNDPLGNFLDEEVTHDINTRASLQLARAAKEAGVSRFLFSSSCSIYGAAGDDFLDESADFNPVTPYGRAKVDVEAGLHELADDGFSPTYLRNATAYGLSPRLRLDLVVNNLVAYAITSGRVYLLSDGTPWRPVVHVQDICSAFLAALEAPTAAIHDQPFNVGRTDENYRIREIADIVAGVVPGSRIEIAPDAGPDLRCYRVDCSKIENELPGFRAEWDVPRGAAELYAAFRASGLQAADLAGSSYVRLNRIRELVEAGELDASDLRPIRPGAGQS